MVKFYSAGSSETTDPRALTFNVQLLPEVNWLNSPESVVVYV
jgi:hypothetical protein